MGKLKWVKELAKKTKKDKAKKAKQKELEAKAKKAWDDSVAKSHEDRHKFKQDMGDMWEAQDKKAAKKIAEKNKKTLDKVKKMEGVSDETKLAGQREGGRRGQNRPEMKLKAHQARERAEKVLGIKKEPTRHAAGGPVKLTDRQYLKGK